MSVSTLFAVLSAAVGAAGWSPSYSGPNSLGRWLHSVPHCSVRRWSCDLLPFTDDVDYMASDEGANRWAETVLTFAFVPFALLALYLLIDGLVRCCCRCCGYSSYLRRQRLASGGEVSEPGLLRRCCCCRSECGVDEDEEDDEGVDAFPSPAARLVGAPAGGSVYGGSGALASEPLLAQTAAYRRGGTAGQTSDTFHLVYDAANPTNQAPHVIAFGAHEVAEIDGSGAAVDARERRMKHERYWRYRMAWALILALLALAALAVSLVFVARGSDSVEDVQHHVEDTRDFFSQQLHDASVAPLRADIDSTHALLERVIRSALDSGNPLTPEQEELVSTTARNYDMLSRYTMAPFQERLSNEAEHVDDVAVWMRDVELGRKLYSYICVGLLMIVTVALLALYGCSRRKPGWGLALLTATSLLIVLVGLVAAAGGAASVGLGDACMSPVAYARAALNSTALLPDDASPYRRAEARTMEFYLDCLQWPDPDSATGAPLPTWPHNPLNSDFLAPLVDALSSSMVGGGLGRVVDFIHAERADLVPLALDLSLRNQSTYAHVGTVQANLGCEAVHREIVGAFETGCKPVVEGLWTAAVLQFAACLLLLFVRCLSLMRLRRADHPLVADPDEHPEPGAAASQAARRPMLKENLLGEPFLYQPSEGPPVGSTNYHQHTETNIRSTAKY